MPLLLNSAASHFQLESLNAFLMLMQDESSVNAGPAVYISPSGPNPIMVQVYDPFLVSVSNSYLVALMPHFEILKQQ